MEVVKAFIALKPGFQSSKDLELDIMNFVRKKLSALAMPREIEFVPGPPKTRSGRIMGRPGGLMNVRFAWSRRRLEYPFQRLLQYERDQ
jgi:hypothetical protein